MRVEVESAICIIYGDITVRQVEYYGWLRIPCGYADTLYTLAHYGALGIVFENGSNCGYKHKGQELIFDLPSDYLFIAF